MVKKRIIWLDMAKGLAIALMVFGHCLNSDLGVRIFIYSFHMPLFFVLAGFTMHAKARLVVIKSSFRRLMVPYFVVSAILLLFAFVPPDSLSSDLDSQRSVPVVLVEILYGSGQEGLIEGHTFQAIGAIWFLPALFFARIIMNEILLWTEKLKGLMLFVQPLAVLVVTWLGFVIGNAVRLPMDIDTAMVATFFMYAGYLVKRVQLERISWWVWIVLIGVWMCYRVTGNNEMAIRAYLDYPWTMLSATAGSIVVMRCLSSLEHVPCLSPALIWAGTSSLLILCVHRIEAAIFNWEKIMETFAPGVWDWTALAQGCYRFFLRFTLVVIVTILIQQLTKLAKRCRSCCSAAACDRSADSGK